MRKPLAIDLYCGLGGWADGFLVEGYDVIGFDIERHDYGTGGYPGQLVLQDVTTLHGSQFKDTTCIVASPPCQAYSYRAMPWKRAKALPPPDNTLFDACFRIQREASEAAGRYIPMVVENVRGAQRWVGRAEWNYGSYYLWGNVPALMPFPKGRKTPIGSWDSTRKNYNPNHSWKTEGHINQRDGYVHARHLTNQRESDAVKQHGSGPIWFDTGIAKHSSRSTSRKAASAMIAKIPYPLAVHIARCFKAYPESRFPPC